MSDDDTLRLGTRASDLALWQADTVRDLLSREVPMRDVELVEVKTLGDRVQDRKIEEIGRTAVFTAELDQALLDGRVDLAVHSLKDVETEPASGIVLAAVLPRGPVEDALVSPHSFGDLPAGARIGTGSVRRVAQLRRLRDDLDIRPIRGNVPTRLEKLDAGEYDGLMMARAGLVRLGLGHRISTVMTPEQIKPAVGQGAIAVTVREGDEAAARIVGGLNHAPTWHIVRIERACLQSLGGGCNVPLGVSCTFVGEDVRFRGGLYAPDGTAAAEVDLTFGASEDPEAAGRRAAGALREGGGEAILDDLVRGRGGEA